MYQNNKEKRFRFKKSAVLAVSVFLLIAAVVGTTVAFLSTRTEDVTNVFEYARVSCYVEETFNGGTKSDVRIENTGTIPAYIRAKVVVTWKDASGNVYGTLPVEKTDYTIEYNIRDNDTEVGWFKASDDGYYYYSKAVDPKQFTGALINSCTAIGGKAPDGYGLSVEIIADAIQSEPKEAVKSAWGVTVADGNLTEN